MNKPIKRTLYIPVEVKKASGNYINNKSVLIVKKQYEMDKNWQDLVEPQDGYFFTSEQLNEYTATVIKQALEIAVKKAECYIFDEGGETCCEVRTQSITNTFEEIFNEYSIADKN